MGIPALVNNLPDQALLASESDAAHVAPMEPRRIASDLLTLVGDSVVLRQIAEFGTTYVARVRSYAAIGPQVTETLRRVNRAVRRHAAKAT